MKEFSTDWFVQNIPIWEKILTPLIGKPIDALEIGCFEGRSTCWLLDNILTNSDSTITCIDSFSSDEELKDTDWQVVKKRFLHNIQEYSEKVTFYHEESKVFLKRCSRRFDFIYIDGSHLASDVLIDAVLSHLLLKSEGIIIFDDYLWKGLENNPNIPKPAIDAFLECFAKEYKILSIGYQVALQKK